MNINKEIEINISDAIVEKAISFSIGKNKLCLYPSTLGKMQILKNLYLSMDVNMELLAINPLVETLRICQEKTVCQVIAYSTFNDRKSILDMEKVLRRARLFQDEASVEDLATILTIILSSDKIEEFIRYFGIDADREMKTRISRIKGEGQHHFRGKEYLWTADRLCLPALWMDNGLRTLGN